MGQVISSFLSDKEREHEEETIERLQILQKLAAAKLEAKSLQMAKDASEDETLPVLAIVDKVERYAVKAETAPARKIRQCIGNIFQGEFQQGLENAVGVAINQFLGNTSAGEQEKLETHVVFANNSLLRVDYYCYKYEFGSRGLKDHFRNMFCYVVHVGIIDTIHVDPQVTLYELGKSIGMNQIEEAQESLEKDSDLLEHLYHILNRLKKAVLDKRNDESTRQETSYTKPESYIKKAKHVQQATSLGYTPNLATTTSSAIQFKADEKRNSDGYMAKIGPQTGRYYCGRNILSCKCCNGHCGPNNGCNCKSCQELDKLSEKPNSDGYMAKIGPQTGRYYCGRNILSCKCCDGHCGPNNGCNCKSCQLRKLRNQLASQGRTFFTKNN